jgi:glutamate synthase domain-containing protein 1
MISVSDLPEKIIQSRKELIQHVPPSTTIQSSEAEGGCGVLGVISSVPIQGKYLVQAMVQMHNRGNGKGGGIAAIGLSAEQMGISSKMLEEDYLLQIAYIDPAIRNEVESRWLHPNFIIHSQQKVSTIRDYRSIELDVKPPEVWRYFVCINKERLQEFIESNKLNQLELPQAEDEFIYQNSYSLNKTYYASLGEKKAFVLSHGKNMMVFKIVGYAEQVLQYYGLEDIEAHIWVGHQRYPTKGKLWHPGGSHPFIGLHDALVHNGDFANYHSISEYLKQKNIYPLFLTDTEVAALSWDLFTRIYHYPLEYVIEVLAPTTERDFVMLPKEKQEIYHTLQTTHIHCSPDGPWFFIIGRNDPPLKKIQLIGITDTSMLRPQVFALQQGAVNIGLIGSEKQAIDMFLQTLANDDKRFYPKADRYWYARGGSYTDGGAFIFTLDSEKNLLCTDKFGKQVESMTYHNDGKKIDHIDSTHPSSQPIEISGKSSLELFDDITKHISEWNNDAISSLMQHFRKCVKNNRETQSIIIETLTLLIDRRYPIGGHRRSDLLALFEETLFDVFDKSPHVGSCSDSTFYSIRYHDQKKLCSPPHPDDILIIDVSDFLPEGTNGTCQFLERVCYMGWKNIIAYRFHGQRNFGAGLITKEKIRIDVYGQVGDCLAAFADGPEFYVHESVQDSVAYCLKSGKLVVYGDVGKTFEYGAKGGIAFILGNLIDRPLINSVGGTTAVINGSCKDYMGESCMAARGFIILNGIAFDDHGTLVNQDTPYHGGNLFPLAAASAVYLRDPKITVHEDQLNGGEIVSLSKEDWEKMLPLLKENERLFGIRIEDLLTIDGALKKPEEVYRKVIPVEVAALTKYDQGI